MIQETEARETGRIALLHYSCPPVIGGVEAVMTAQARLFAGAGYDVTIIAGRGAGSRARSGRITTVIEPLIDSKHERILALNRALDRGELPSDLKPAQEEIYARLKPLLQGFDTCIVHNAFTLHKNLALTGALAALAWNMPDTKFIAWCHDLAWADPLYASVLHDGPPWNLLRTVVPGLIYVAISDKRRDQIVQLFQPTPDPASIPVVPNGVSLAEFLKLSRETRAILEAAAVIGPVQAGALMLLLPARITRRKNIELALRIVAALKLRQAVRLIVTGPPGPHNPTNDEYVRELMALRAELGIEEEVIFLMERWQNEAGRPRIVSDEAIADLYRFADALLFPSTQEGFGIPILEAGLDRLPIFCSRLQPFEAVAGDLPNYFDPADPPAVIADLILTRLQADPQHLLRRRVLETYTWESIFEKQIEPLVRKD